MGSPYHGPVRRETERWTDRQGRWERERAAHNQLCTRIVREKFALASPFLWTHPCLSHPEVSYPIKATKHSVLERPRIKGSHNRTEGGATVPRVSLGLPPVNSVLLPGSHRSQACLAAPVPVAGHLQQLEPSQCPLLSDKEQCHKQQVDAQWWPEPETQAAKPDEGIPVEQRGRFDHQHSCRGLAGWYVADTRRGVEAPRAHVEVAKPPLLLCPALLAPGLQLFGRVGQLGCRIPLHVEVDLLGELAQYKVTLRLWDVLRVGHSDVVNGIQIVSCSDWRTIKGRH